MGRARTGFVSDKPKSVRAERAADSPARGDGYPDILKSPGLLSRVLDIADDAIISIDAQQRICIFNQGAERMFGFAASEVLGKTLSVLLPPRFRDHHEQHVRDFAQSTVASRVMAQRSEIFGRRRNGQEFPAEASISKVDLGGELILTVILRDVTDRKAAERRIQEALEEKEVLLREIHHRVKNNLQVVSSLLSLQARASEDPSVRRTFEESQSRVQSMALIHEQLYGSSSFAAVDFAEYIRQLTSRLVRSYRTSADGIELDLDVEDVRLGVDSAVPCGLIVNELVSNALKYAFPDERAGKVRLTVVRLPDHSVLLNISDDGVGLPPELGFWNTKTLGLRLVRTLVRQLDGEIEVGGPPGAEFRIRFSPD